MTHDYAPLGSWYGQTTFFPRGSQQQMSRFDFSHKLTYKPPAKGADIGGMAINSADFRVGAAGGTIYFDAQRKRVHTAQERFHVRGDIGANVLGQAANVSVEEQQAITIRVHDQDPRP